MYINIVALLNTTEYTIGTGYLSSQFSDINSNGGYVLAIALSLSALAVMSIEIL
jgi:hypothetical protein